MVVRLQLPWPPSLNTLWRHVGHRVLLSRDGRRYRERVAAACVGAPRLEGSLRFDGEFTPPDRRKFDLDNRVKAVLDALQAAGVFGNDNQVNEIHIRKNLTPVAGGRLLATLHELDSTVAAAATESRTSPDRAPRGAEPAAPAAGDLLHARTRPDASGDSPDAQAFGRRLRRGNRKHRRHTP